MKLDITATMDAIAPLQGFAADFCAADPALSGQENVLALILEELVTNTVTHGGAVPDSIISVNLLCRGGAIELVYEDSGCPFNPCEQLPEDDRDKSVEMRRTGGLGWHLIQEMCASVDYEHRDGRNRLTMIRETG